MLRVLPMRHGPLRPSSSRTITLHPSSTSTFTHKTSPAALSSILRVLPSFSPSSAQARTLFPAMPKPSLPRAQMRLLRDIGYEEKLNLGRRCGEVNARVVGRIGNAVRSQLSHSQAQPAERPWWDWIRGFREGIRATGNENGGDVGRIREALRHAVRDWSEEGQLERERVFGPVLEALRRVPDDGGHKDGASTRQILIPGCGLGRLAYDIAQMDANWEVTAIELSPYMNIVRRVILPPPFEQGKEEIHRYTIHPFSWWWSHQRNTDNLFRAASFPDIVPAHTPNLTFVEGNFLEHKFETASSPSPTADPLFAVLRSSPPLSLSLAGYDTIVTLFFIDALPNPVRTMSHIYSLLRPGGIWINLGPLLYGVGGKAGEMVELTLDEVVGVAEGLGFEFDKRGGEGKTRTVECEYTCDDRAMMRWLYQAEFWVARKV